MLRVPLSDFITGCDCVIIDLSDLNQPPRNYLTASLFGGDAARSPGAAARVPAPVLRERDWGDRDIFSSLRTTIEFETSGLAGMGGDADVHFIAPTEQMKRLFMMPYSPGRVAFPVHRVGSALVIDGIGTSTTTSFGTGGFESTGKIGERRALVDALGRIMTHSEGPSADGARAQ